MSLMPAIHVNIGGVAVFITCASRGMHLSLCGSLRVGIHLCTCGVRFGICFCQAVSLHLRAVHISVSACR
jgi:hypothetical protein